MAVVINDENFGEIKEKIKRTEAEINELTERIKSKEAEKERVTDNYENKKADFEDFRREYVYQSTSGLYFLIVSAIAFVFIAYGVLTHSILGFMIIPAAVLFAAGIFGKYMGITKFNKMKPVMEDKQMAYDVAKEGYDLFMKDYNSDVNALLKKQYEWESVENNMIEAKKDAWIAAQNKAAAKAE